MIHEERGSWYLITGLVVGLGIGLLYAWVINPVKYINTSPASLRADFKGQYRSLIALAYASSDDIGRARARLALLGDPDPARALAVQAQQILAAGGSASDARSLAFLAAAMGQNPALAAVTPNQTEGFQGTTSSTIPNPGQGDLSPTAPLSAVKTATPTPNPTPSRTPLPPLPTRTLTPTPGAPFVLKGTPQILCDSSQPVPLLEVEVQDSRGVPVPGAEVIVTWNTGEDHFYTGLKPEIDMGYADFEMATDQTYSLRLANGGELVNGLRAKECLNIKGLFASVKLLFSRP